MKQRLLKLCLGVMALLWIGIIPAWAAEPVIFQTIVVVSDDKGQPLPSRLALRIQASVQAVAAQVLVGRPIAVIESKRGAYERMVCEVFDRILIGYSVETASISVGEKTKISLRLTPWGDVVEKTELLWDDSTFPSKGREALRFQVEPLKKVVDEVLLGMPVDAADWGAGLVRTVVRDWFEDQLPEFRPEVEISVAKTTQVKLTMTPRAPLVQALKVTLRSRSLPNLLLYTVQKDLEQEGQGWLQLPVSFVARQEKALADQLLLKAANHAWVKQLGLQIRIAEVRAGPVTEVVLDAESRYYRMFAEGYLDMGKKDEATRVRLHAGWKATPQGELFFEGDFFPSDVKNRWYSGLGWQVSSQTEAGVKYKLQDGEKIFWMRQQLGGPWSLRLERYEDQHASELGVRYRLHEFLSAEYILTNKERWLRLIATF
ncbi:hypothetical protein [Anaeroarcus burkinensis]|uniref:hypothetical protein n=1 Tax=Anaeroarcus burkinensis TaxID=82376 RepID=UPI000409F245|nr:hypothetical protein [Anaeroarcus burkinensis]